MLQQIGNRIGDNQESILIQCLSEWIQPDGHSGE